MALRAFLDRLYDEYNRKAFIGTDPLRFVLQYDSREDREVAGLLAACLAFGRVEQICRSVGRVLSLLGAPAARVDSLPRGELRDLLGGFRHRFVSGEDVADLLEGVRRVRSRWGTLNRYFLLRCYEPACRRGEDMRAAASAMVEGLGVAGCRPGFLLPHPSRGSACKRLHLFLRWMVRCDEVDPGAWEGIPPGALMVPLDTHMHRVCSLLGLTGRRQADGRAAREVTDAFLRLRPEDPVRYDFSLTRLGMWDRLDAIPRALLSAQG